MVVLVIVLCLLSPCLALPRPHIHLHRGSNVGQKIVGGQEVEPHSIPYQVSLQLKSYQNWHFCGGAIISNDYVVTAAHCCDGQDVSDIQVVAGEHDLYVDK